MLTSIREIFLALPSSLSPVFGKTSSYSQRKTRKKSKVSLSSTPVPTSTNHIHDPQFPPSHFTRISPSLRRRKGEILIPGVISIMTDRDGQPLSEDSVRGDLLKDLDELSDVMAGQDSELITYTGPSYRDIKIEASEKTVLATFANYILQLKDGLDPRIIEALDTLNKMENNAVPSIRQQYTKLHSLLKEDFWQITWMLSASVQVSFGPLKLCIEISIQSYQIALAKDIGTKLSDISSMRDDMVARAKEYREQEMTMTNGTS